jgi:hypothetical protein
MKRMTRICAELTLSVRIVYFSRRTFRVNGCASGQFCDHQSQEPHTKIMSYV